MKQPSNFNLRAYGLLLVEDKLLVMEESFLGEPIYKFPGGGVEFGEGPKDTVVREMEEELGLKVCEADHFYTTENFVQSAFKKEDQLISIYYKVKVSNLPDLNFNPEDKGDWKEVALHWMDLNEIGPEDLSLPVDRKVVEMLKS